MPTEMEDRADRVMNEMLRFGEGVIEYQTRNLRREDLDYSALGFDVMCHGFMAGSMLVISERYTLPTAPRDVAFLGLLKHLMSKRGWSLDAARKRVIVINESGPGSIGQVVFDAGYRHWRNPNALRILMQSERPKEWWSQSWVDANQARSKRILRRLVFGCGVAALLLTGWLLGRLG